MPAAAVVAVGSVAAAAIQSSSARSAAKTSARAYQAGISTQQQMASEARSDILDRMVPSLERYNAGIRNAQSEIANGTADVMQILQEYTGNADQIITQAGADAQKAIMGSSASAAGVPASQFNSMYNQAQALPPTARTQAFDQMNQAFSTGAQQAATTGGTGTNVAQQAATSATGTTPAQAVAATTTAVNQAATMGVQPTQTPAANQMPMLQTAAIGDTGTGYLGAMGNLQQGYSTAQQALNLGTAQARADLTGGTQSALSQLASTKTEALGQLSPYTTAGESALQQEAALSGALGAEAQQAAIDAYIESPGQAYLRQQQEKALLRNQAAIGGLGGGNVRTALQEQAMNIASTQQQQYLENLRSLATRGQEAATTGAGITTSTGLAGAEITANIGNVLAQLAQQYGISSANLAQMSSSEMAQLANATGINLSTLTQATAAAKAGLQTELGSGLAQATATKTSAIADLIQTGATNTMNTQQNISQMLANLATGTGTNITNLQLGQGQSLAAGQYLQGQALASGLQGLGQAALYANTGGTSSGTDTLGTQAYSGGQSTVADITDMSHLYTKQ